MAANSVKTYSHVLAKLSVAAGPDPATELRNIVRQCRRDPNSVAWFATLQPGKDFLRAGNSICVIFHHPDESSRVEAVVARVVSMEQAGSPQEGAEVRAFYQAWADRLTNWWRLGEKPTNNLNCDVVLTEFESLEAIPGCQWKSGKTARDTFVAQCSFAGWTFEETFNPLDWLRKLPKLVVDRDR
jgi:hypothetical protein